MQIITIIVKVTAIICGWNNLNILNNIKNYDILLIKYCVNNRYWITNVETDGVNIFKVIFHQQVNNYK